MCVCVCVCMYIYIYVCVCMYVCMYLCALPAEKPVRYKTILYKVKIMWSYNYNVTKTFEEINNLGWRG